MQVENLGKYISISIKISSKARLPYIWENLILLGPILKRPKLLWTASAHNKLCLTSNKIGTNKICITINNTRKKNCIPHSKLMFPLRVYFKSGNTMSYFIGQVSRLHEWKWDVIATNSNARLFTIKSLAIHWVVYRRRVWAAAY